MSYIKLSFSDYEKIVKVGDELEINIFSNGQDTHYFGKVTSIDSIGRKFLFSRTKNYKGTVLFYFNRDNSPDNWIRIINGSKQEIKKTSKVKSTRQMEIIINGKLSSLSIFLKIPKEIENYYKGVSQGKVEVSKNWLDKKKKGVKFYMLNDVIKKSEKDIDKNTFSEFGSGLLDDDYINTAMLRTVGASDGIEIMSANFSKATNIDLEFYVKRLGEFTSKLWESAISDKKIKALITFEL